MGKNVATLELELFKRHTEELILLINAKKCLEFYVFIKATYV